MIDLGTILGWAVPELTLLEETPGMNSFMQVLSTTKFQSDLAITSFIPTVVMILPTVMMVIIRSFRVRILSQMTAMVKMIFRSWTMAAKAG